MYFFKEHLFSGLFWLSPSKADLVKAIKTDKHRLPADRKEDLLFIKDQCGGR